MGYIHAIQKNYRFFTHHIGILIHYSAHHPGKIMLGTLAKQGQFFSAQS